jgi:hypothetical protein
MKTTIRLAVTLTISLLVFVFLSTATVLLDKGDESSYEDVLNGADVVPTSVFSIGVDSDNSSDAAVASHYDGATEVPLDDRGDINLNGVPNEIADAVMLSKYFVYGLDVFHINQPAQVAATDVNADGLTLSVADLVHLIRIVE